MVSDYCYFRHPSKAGEGNGFFPKRRIDFMNGWEYTLYRVFDQRTIHTPVEPSGGAELR
jgi:hypothetical protein